MTIATTTTLNRYTGNAATTVFPYTFRILAATDLVVTKLLAGTLVPLTLSYPADYSVSGVGNTTGGSITLNTAPATGDLLVIERVMAVTQSTSIRNNGSYFAETHENVFDRGTMVDQQQATAIGRTFQLPKTIDPATMSMSLPVPVSGQVLAWAPTGLTNSTVASGSVVLPGAGRTTSTLSTYLANNYVYNVFDYDAQGDGATNDGPAIANAIAAAVAAGGGAVYFPYSAAGFLITAQLNITSAVPLTLTGPGTIKVSGNTRGIVLTGASRVMIDGLTLDGQSVGSQANQNLIEINTNSDDITVRRCRLLDAGACPIRVDQSTNVRVAENYVNASYDNGIWVTKTVGIDVLFNQFTNVGSLATLDSHGTAIEMSVTGSVATGVERFRIIGNHIVNPNRLGVELFNDLTDPTIRVQKGCVIGNHVEQTRITGNSTCYSLAGCAEVTVTGNTAEQGSLGFELAFSRGCTMTGNTSRNAGTGFALNGGGNGGLTECVVTNNTAYHSTSAAFQFAGTGHAYNTIQGNTGTGAGGATTARGFFGNSAGSINSVVRGNTMTGFGQSGFYFQDTYDCLFDGNIALGNNTSANVNEEQIYFNMSSQSNQARIEVGRNFGKINTNASPIDALTSALALSASATTSLGLKWRYRAGEKWRVVYRLPVQITGGVAGLKFDLASLPAGVTGRMRIQGNTSGTTATDTEQVTTLTSSSSTGFLTASFTGYVELWMYLSGGTADGDIDLQVITGASAAGSIFAGASMERMRVG